MRACPITQITYFFSIQKVVRIAVPVFGDIAHLALTDILRVYHHDECGGTQFCLCTSPMIVTLVKIREETGTHQLNVGDNAGPWLHQNKPEGGG